jgi:hypothetical protein
MAPALAVILILVGVGLLRHHGWKHHFEAEPSAAREESCGELCVGLLLSAQRYCAFRNVERDLSDERVLVRAGIRGGRAPFDGGCVFLPGWRRALVSQLRSVLL